MALSAHEPSDRVNVDLIRFKQLRVRHGVRGWVLEFPFADHPEPVWPGLWELDYPDGSENPFLSYGINNAASEAFHLLRAIAWAVDCEGVRILCPTYYRDETAAILGRPREDAILVGWQYEIDVEGNDLLEAERGFVQGRACVPIRPEPDPWQSAHRHQAGLFPVQEFAQFSAADVACGFDASSEITLYTARAERVEDLTTLLNGTASPSLVDVLNAVNTLVDVTQLRDPYSTGASRIAVYSRNDLTQRLDDLALRGRQAWTRYENAARGLTGWKEFHAAIAELTRPILSS